MTDSSADRAIDAWAQPLARSAGEALPEVARLFKQSGSAHLLDSEITPEDMVRSMDEMIGVAWKHENVFIDTSAHLPRYYPPQLLHYMRTYGKDKMLFGTNSPQLTFEKCAEQARALDLPDEVRARFMRENARRVFKLD
jgi:hypothetical protein